MNGQPPGEPSLVEWGVAALTAAGETESGDQHLVKPFPDGVLLAVVDGLGHGDQAALAAKLAIETMATHVQESAISLIIRCHQALIKTRGAVITLASISARDNTMTWIGVGNVEGMLVRGDSSAGLSREVVLLRGGVVGYNLPSLRAMALPIVPGDTLIFATDGISADFPKALVVSDSPQQTSDRICSQYAKKTDDALVLVARYLGRTS